MCISVLGGALGTVPLPPQLDAPFGQDSVLNGQGWLSNDPWGVYSGTAFCHDICNYEGMCEGVSNATSDIVIESPATLVLNGIDATVHSGSINFNWQIVRTPDGGFLGARDVSNLPLTTDNQNMTAPATRFYPSQQEGRLDNVTGALQIPNLLLTLLHVTGAVQLYAQGVIAASPGSDEPWGWVFSTFAGEALEYSAAYGEASLKGRVFIRYYSTHLYTATCGVALSRSTKFDYRPNPVQSLQSTVRGEQQQ